MSTEIKYTNFFGQPVSEQQVVLLENYNKLTFIDGQLKLRELLITRKNDIGFREFYYYLDSNENKQDIVSQYSNEDKKWRCTIYLNKQIINGFIVWDVEYYGFNSVFAGYGKQVFDNQMREVMFCNYDSVTNEPINVNKKFYLEEYQPLGMLVPIKNIKINFSYTDYPQPDDSPITISSSDSEDYFLKCDLDDLLLIFPDFFSEHSYFQNKLPLVPTTILI